MYILSLYYARMSLNSTSRCLIDASSFYSSRSEVQKTKQTFRAVGKSTQYIRPSYKRLTTVASPRYLQLSFFLGLLNLIQRVATITQLSGANSTSLRVQLVQASQYFYAAYNFNFILRCSSTILDARPLAISTLPSSSVSSLFSGYLPPFRSKL